MLRITSVFCAFIFSLPLLAQNHAEMKVLEVSLDPKHILDDHFLGFGVQWEYQAEAPQMNVESPAWNSRWKEMERRIDYMRPSIFRVMHEPHDYATKKEGKITLDFENEKMLPLYKVLDYAESRKIPVVFGEWNLSSELLKPLGGYGSPRWQEELFVPQLKYLTEQRKYSMIQYLNLVNEPKAVTDLDQKNLTFATWKQVMVNLQKSLDVANLGSRFKIVGTDGPGDWEHWLEMAARDRELNKILSAYEYHLYAPQKTSIWSGGIDDGRFETDQIGVRRRMVNALDPNGAKKPFFMGECAVDRDDHSIDTQPLRMKFSYGVSIADYAIQIVRAGLSGAIYWDMDDAMHWGGGYGKLNIKGWGFWNSLAGEADYPANDFDLRPCYYAWSLICRAFPKGAKTFFADPSIDRSERTVRVAACELPDHKGYSFAIVNRSPNTFKVNLKSLEALTVKKLRVYRYQSEQVPLDEKGEFKSDESFEEVDLVEGLKIECLKQSLVVLTTVE